jgi:HD-GYP domain-containing protein (c-di-GMP phosphodiesterase class II)
VTLGLGIRFMGGVNVLNPSILLIPAILAAWLFGFAGGVLGGLAAGLVVGPWMPATAGAAQPASDWMVRLVLYAAVGATAGLFVHMLQSQLEHTRRAHERVETLRGLDLAILRSAETDELFGGLGAVLSAISGVRGAALYAVDRTEPVRVSLRTAGTVPPELYYGRGRHAMDELARECVTRELSEHREAEAPSAEPVQLESVEAVPLPLHSRRDVLGIGLLFVDGEVLPREFLDAVHGQLTIALGSWFSHARAVQVQHRAVFQLGVLSEARDGFSENHLRRVQGFARVVAEEMGISGEQAEELGVAATVHDIGKIRVPEAILSKPDRLTEEEFAEVKHHTRWGAEVLKRVGLETAASIACRHHERWDGGGYPDGLVGERIPFAARVVAIADVFDALTSARPYKDAWPEREAVETIRAERGTHFDPAVHDAFMACWEDERISELRQTFRE